MHVKMVHEMYYYNYYYYVVVDNNNISYVKMMIT